MARISTYSTDPNITADDKWIGTDFNTQYTKNFTPQYLADFFNISNSIGVSGQVSFKYYSVFPSGFRPEESITTQTVDPNFSSITSLKIHKNSGGGKYCVDFVNYLSGDEILVSDTSNANIFGHFKLNSVTQDLSETNFYNLSVTYLGGNGNLQHLKVYSIALYSMDIIVPTLQSVVEQGRTFTETDTSTDYSFELFGGIGALKRLYASIVNAGNTSIFSFIRNAFTLKTFSSANNSSEIATSGSGVTLRHTNSVNTQTLRVVQNPTAPASTEFRTPAISDSSTYSLAVMPRVTTSDITASAGVEYNASSVSNITFTDPTSGAVSFLEVGYRVFAFRGTVTVGGIIYPQGTYLLRQRNSSTTLWQTTILNSDAQDLQSVTDIGNTTTNAINALSFVSNDGFGGSSSLSGSSIDIYDATGAYFTNFGSASSLYLSDISGNSFSVNNNTIELVDPLGNNANISISGIGLYNNTSGDAWSLNYPTKPNGYVGTFAMLSDIPATPNLQTVTGVGANTNISITVEDTTLPLLTYSRLSKGGLYVYTSAEQSSLSHAQLSFQRGGTVVNTLSIEPGGISRNCNFFLPSKTNGNYILATTSDSLLTEFVVDSYIGTRLKPSNALGNGFYFERNANESVGYSAVNTNTGNGAVALNGVGIDTNPYIKNISITKFGPNYYVPLLAGKGGVIGTEEVFLGSRDGNDVSILTGADITTLSRKFTVKANGQLQIQTTPTTGTTSDKLLVRDTSGNVKQIDYPTGGGISHTTASGTDTYTATVTGVVAYADGDAYLVRFTNGNTTGCTLNINGLGAIPLFRNNDGPLLGGDILDGGEMLCIYNSTLVEFQVIGISPNSLIAYVTNADSVTITKGMPVYAFSGTGDRMTVKRAFNTSDATSAQTVGLVLSTSIAANQKGIIMMQGLLDGLSILPTATFADGDPVYLGSTAGTITNVKPYAPNHLVYLGVVTTASNGSAGRMYVRVQNGYELDELHNVQAQSPTYKDVLYYDNTVSPPQWKTASIETILGAASSSTNGYLTYADWNVFNNKLPTEAGSTTGVSLTFITDRVYGTIASPETGNITADVTGALLGVTNIIIHNSGTAPTFGAEFKKLSGSGNYVTSVVNYIYCTYINATEIIYSINQRT